MQEIVLVFGSMALLVYASSVMWMILDIRLADVKKKNRIIAAGITGIMLIINLFVALRYGYETYSSLYPVLAQIPVFAVFFFLSRYRGMKLVFMLLSTIVFSSPPMVISMALASSFNHNIIIKVIVQVLSYLILLFVIKKYFAPLFVYMLDNCEKGWLGLSIIPIMYYFIIYLSSEYNYTAEYWENMKVYRLPLCVLIIAVYILILYLFRQAREQLILQNESHIFRLQMEAAADKLDQVSQSNEQLRVYRHDMRHHLQYINACIENDNGDEAKSYIHSLCERIDSTKAECFCENKAANLILSSYAHRAEESGIRLYTKVSLPEILKLSNIELCVIIGNIVQNALNACEKLKTSERKEVFISAEMRNNKVFLSVKNHFDGEITFENGVPITAEKGHGIGVRSVTEIVRKHGGMCNFTIEDDLFSFIMLM